MQYLSRDKTLCMKFKLLLLSCFSLWLFNMVCAQVPQMFNYQVIARDPSGLLYRHTHVSFRYTIQEGVNPGVPLYAEFDTGTTNGFGAFTSLIGDGPPVLGDFTAINWATGNKYLMIEFDPTGGTTFLNMGVTQLVSVPYALYADSVGRNSYPTHHLGDHYGGGIIFQIDSAGQHGLIADTADLDTGIVWTSGAFNISNATRNGIGAGRFNTERIIIRQGTGAYAAQVCADYQGGGYSDWYLPSVNELNILYQQQNMVGGFTSNAYWSSNELSNQQATAITFNGGGFTPSVKTTTHPIRAVRAF